MLNTRIGWKIHAEIYMAEKDGEEEVTEVGIVFSKEDAKAIISKIVEEKAEYNYRPFEFERLFYESENKVNVMFRTKDDRRKFTIEAQKINIVEEAG